MVYGLGAVASIDEEQCVVSVVSDGSRVWVHSLYAKLGFDGLASDLTSAEPSLCASLQSDAN